MTDPTSEQAVPADAATPPEVPTSTDLLVEEVSIDGLCGVY